MPKSSEEYALDGNQCPVCGGRKVHTNGNPQWAGEVADIKCNVACDDCGSTWVSIYNLAGYRELLDPRAEYTVTLLYPGDSNETYVSTTSALSVGEAVQLVQEEAATINGGATYSVEDFPVLTCMHVEDGKIVVDL